MIDIYYSTVMFLFLFCRDLAKDLNEVNDRFGYDYIELQLVSVLLVANLYLNRHIFRDVHEFMAHTVCFLGFCHRSLSFLPTPGESDPTSFTGM